jgi:ArsR family transcriptional regulator, lead/cadmium/zinc/bismuth-responsive transcriptional repressor
MGERTRAKIIGQLRKSPKNVSEIVRTFKLKQPTITHHLKFLEKTGLLLHKKEGREMYYYINKKHPCGKC